MASAPADVADMTWTTLRALGPDAETALNAWASHVDMKLNYLHDQTESVRSRVISLEVRTGAAVTEGTSQVARTVEEIMKTQAYLQGVDVAAARATEGIRADLMQIADGAKQRFDAQAQVDEDIKKRIEMLGGLAQNLGTESDRRFKEQEEKMRQLIAAAKAEFETLRAGLDKVGGASQSGTAGQDPWRSGAGDPWHSHTNQRATSQPAASSAGLGQTVSSAPAAGVGRKPYQVSNRDWGDNKKLDLVTEPEGYLTWRERALDFLAKDRPDIYSLLLWAEKLGRDPSKDEEAVEIGRLGIQDDPEGLNFVLFAAIKHVVTDGLLSRARNCGTRGLILWRALHSEWKGNSAQVLKAKSMKFVDPPRCGSVGQLWNALPAWLMLEEELKNANYQVPEWLRASALDKLVPTKLLEAIVARPDLSNYSAKLAWIQAQMAHERGEAQALALEPRKQAGRPARDGDVEMGTIGGQGSRGKGLLWSLAEESNRCVQAGDWKGYEETAYVLQALSKAKGKGKGKGLLFGKGLENGDSRKGAHKGGGKAGGKGGKGFKGACWGCGEKGHRQSECPHNKIQELNEEEGADAERADNDEELGEDDWWVGGCDALAFDEDAVLSHDPGYDRSRSGRSACKPQGNMWRVPTGNRFQLLEEEEIEDYPTVQRAAAAAPPPKSALKPRRVAKSAKWIKWTPDDDLEAPPLGLQVARQPRQFPDMNLLEWSEGELEGPDDNMLCQVCNARDGTSMSKKGRWVEAVVDSGAVASVAKRGTFPGKITASPMSRAKKGYKSASRHKIPNEGQQKIRFGTQEGHTCGIKIQVADVERPLISTADLTAAGNRVIIEGSEGYIENIKTGKRIVLPRRGNVYILRMWIEDEPVFSRQGK